MGCTHGRTNYIDSSKFEQEKYIRKWENDLGLKNKTFFDLISNFNSKIILEGEEIPQSKLDNFITTNFNNNAYLKDVLSFPIFHVKNKIDCRIIKFLFFSLCPIEILTNDSATVTYTIDKAEYLFTHVKETDEANENDELDRFGLGMAIEPVITIACEVIPDCYIKHKKTEITKEEDKYLSKLRDFIPHIREKIVDDLFKNKNTVGLCDISQAFEENPYYLTTGYIRDIGLEILKKELTM